MPRVRSRQCASYRMRNVRFWKRKSFWHFSGSLPYPIHFGPHWPYSIFLVAYLLAFFRQKRHFRMREMPEREKRKTQNHRTREANAQAKRTKRTNRIRRIAGIRRFLSPFSPDAFVSLSRFSSRWNLPPNAYWWRLYLCKNILMNLTRRTGTNLSNILGEKIRARIQLSSTEII